MLLLTAGVWIARRPIATQVLQDQFEQKGVRATYSLDRVGLRTQEVSNLVIGDPKNPDLVARYAKIQLRWTLTGSVGVYRIVARGVRLKGKVVDGRVVWGDVSKMLPPPSDKPFALPNIVLDIADSSIGLQTPFGNLGFALAGTGNLTGGFKGRLAADQPAPRPRPLPPRRDAGLYRCAGRRAAAAGRRAVPRETVCLPREQHRPRSSRAFDLNTSFNESFTSFDGNARVTTQQVIAGANGLAAMTGNVRFTGTPKAAYGQPRRRSAALAARARSMPSGRGSTAAT